MVNPCRSENTFMIEKQAMHHPNIMFTTLINIRNNMFKALDQDLMLMKSNQQKQLFFTLKNSQL